jgi:hypothetical protein
MIKCLVSFAGCFRFNELLNTPVKHAVLFYSQVKLKFSANKMGNYCELKLCFVIMMGRGRDRVLVGLTTTYAISAYHH